MVASSLRRIYSFSDTYGRHKSFFVQDDADAIISTHFRSFPLRQRTREFDIYGRENITAHILRLIFALHTEVLRSPYFPQKIKSAYRKTLTGIFINAAPRTTREGGTPFYVATATNLRIVTTDLQGLSSVKEEIESLAHLPNKGQKLFKEEEQFRSSYAAYLLDPNHNLTLVPDSLDVIPDYPEDLWELSYVDRFGNIMTYTKHPQKIWKEICSTGRKHSGRVKLIIGNVSQDVCVGSSLKTADPGNLVIYPNNENLEILRKWTAEEGSRSHLYNSAYFKFEMPDLGDLIKLAR